VLFYPADYADQFFSAAIPAPSARKLLKMIEAGHTEVWDNTT
jgi:hypothetical protein